MSTGGQVILLTFGSSGDIHPFLGLGRRFRDRGTAVTLVTNLRYADLAAAHDLDFVGIGSIEGFDAIMRDPDIWHHRRGAYKILTELADSVPESYAALETLVAGREAQTVIVASTLGMAGRLLHERTGQKLVSVHLSAMVFRSQIDPPRLPGLPPIDLLPAFLRRRVLKGFWDGADRFVLDKTLAKVNAFRQGELGFESPIVGLMGDYFHAPQRTLGLWPAWFTPVAVDWPKQVKLCGFPLYDERLTAAIPADLEAFLQAGLPPIAFTPGSAMLFGSKFFKAAVNACQRLGRRGVLLTRHPEQLPASLPPSVIHASFAPFGALLPRCAALVHHGGVGTLSQGFAAGIPQVVMPMAHDQFENARQLRRLGVGLSLARRRFIGRRLAKRLSVLLQGKHADDVARRCRELASRLSHEDGLALAVKEIEAVLYG